MIVTDKDKIIESMTTVDELFYWIVFVAWQLFKIIVVLGVGLAILSFVIVLFLKVGEIFDKPKVN